MIEKIVEIDLKRKFEKAENLSLKKEIIKGLRILENKDILFPGFFSTLRAIDSIYDSKKRNELYNDYKGLRSNSQYSNKKVKIQGADPLLLQLADNYNQI